VLLHLVPLGRGRFDLYGEPPDEDDEPPEAEAGRIRRWAHAAREQWRRLVDRARMRTPEGRFARWRDTLISQLAESIDEQRTLWALRKVSAATLLYAKTSDEPGARASLDRILADARKHHGWWLAIDLTLFIASGILFFIPGPNVVAYYLGFRVFGHLQSWRGARQASSVVQWTLAANDQLAELETLAAEPHARRADRVKAIADILDLPRLPAFFERAAA
jgi:hypothetical protein